MKHSLYIAAIMLLVLILSQGYWLYNIYNAEKYKTQEVLEELFEEAALEKSYKHLCALRDEVIAMGVLPAISEWHKLNPNIK